jgi:hypothetical protein
MYGSELYFGESPGIRMCGWKESEWNGGSEASCGMNTSPKEREYNAESYEAHEKDRVIPSIALWN